MQTRSGTRISEAWFRASLRPVLKLVLPAKLLRPETAKRIITANIGLTGRSAFAVALKEDCLGTLLSETDPREVPALANSNW